MKATRFEPAWVAVVLLLFALVLTGCGGGATGSGDGSSSSGVDAGSDEGGSARSTVYEVDPGGEMAQSAPDEGGNMPSSGGELEASGGSAPEAQELPEDFDRMIVKSAELGLRAEDVRDSAAEAQQVAARFGGSVLDSQINGSEDAVSADLVLTVPSPEFEKALDELRSLGKKVTTDAVRGEDVTEEFVDLESRERNLLAAEQTLLELYDRAQNVGDALSIERELANIRGQIEQVQGRIQYLEDRTASSEISLHIQPVTPPPPPPPAWSAATVAADAWDASLNVLQALATAVISAVVFGWWLVPVFIAGFVWWRRRTRGPGTAGSET